MGRTRAVRMDWSDMNQDQRQEYVDREARRISRHYARKIARSIRRSELKVNATPKEYVARRIAIKLQPRPTQFDSHDFKR